MAKKYDKEMLKVRVARMHMLSKHPFWGSLACSIPIEFDESILTEGKPTAATNGEKIIFHPQFVKELTNPQLVFVLAHEVQHCALMHPLRRGNREPNRWNVACDIVDNYLLIENGVGEMPGFGIHNPDLYHQGGGKVEKIYELLPECDDPGSGTSPGGMGSMDIVLDADPKNKDNIEANMRNNLQQALQSAKDAGNVPGGIEDFVTDLTTPKVSWQQHLRNFVMTTRGTDRTYAKRNRRYAAHDLILPGTYGDRMGQLGFAIDCSGSTSDEMVSQGGTEGRSIQEEIRPELTHVFYFDTDVKKHDEYESDDPVEMKVYGRGGTCFRTTFEYIEENGIELECLVVLTDLDCHDFGPTPPYPVLWLVEENDYTKHLAKNVPFGQVVFYN